MNVAVAAAIPYIKQRPHDSEAQFAWGSVLHAQGCACSTKDRQASPGRYGGYRLVVSSSGAATGEIPVETNTSDDKR
jgi:hypothetical protein